MFNSFALFPSRIKFNWEMLLATVWQAACSSINVRNLTKKFINYHFTPRFQRTLWSAVSLTPGRREPYLSQLAQKKKLIVCPLLHFCRNMCEYVQWKPGVNHLVLQKLQSSQAFCPSRQIVLVSMLFVLSRLGFSCSYISPCVRGIHHLLASQSHLHTHLTWQSVSVSPGCFVSTHPALSRLCNETKAGEKSLCWTVTNV